MVDIFYIKWGYKSFRRKRRDNRDDWQNFDGDDVWTYGLGEEKGGRVGEREIR